MTLYTRHQLSILLVLLVTAGLGLAVGHWRRGHPELAERVERFDARPAPEPPPAPPPPARSGAGGGPRGRPKGAGARAPDPSPGGAPAARPRAPKTDATPLDVNHAAAEALVRLPGVGPALAARIVAARQALGPFATVDDLRRVRGLGRAKLERLRPLVRAGE
jgi:competence ComEA-like helix-hairpin-helix protein